MPAIDFITVVSTRTTDRLPSRDGKTVREFPGGPAHYITRALDLIGQRYELVTGEDAIVEVVRHDEETEYIIPPLPAISLPPRLAGRAAILSPIVNEINPASVPPSDGPLVIDLQGFVRRPGRSTAELVDQVDLRDLLERADVVKGSPSELARLSTGSRDALLHAVVLETRGAEGAIVHAAGMATHVEAVPVSSPNFIGAGDTFLAAYVVAALDGATPHAAALQAARFTEAVLAGRLTDLENTI